MSIFLQFAPLLSDNAKSRDKITLVEDKTITTQDEKNAEILIFFFIYLFIFFQEQLKIVKYLNLMLQIT